MSDWLTAEQAEHIQWAVQRNCPVGGFVGGLRHATLHGLLEYGCLSGLSGDGCDSVHDCFGQRHGAPLLAHRAARHRDAAGRAERLHEPAEWAVRHDPNPLAHDPKVEWDMTEQDALDILTTISLVHRKLDQVYRFRT